MTKAELKILKDNIISRKINKYISLSLDDSISNIDIIKSDMYYDYELNDRDDSKELSKKIGETLEKLIGKISYLYGDFDDIVFSIYPNLFINIDTILNKDESVIDNQNIEYDDKHVSVLISFSIIKGDNILNVDKTVLDGVVNYANFYNEMSDLGFDLVYKNIDELIVAMTEKILNGNVLAINELLYGEKQKVKNI
jgi:hypothetical protein